MSFTTRLITLIGVVAPLTLVILYHHFYPTDSSTLPLLAIANYGPHSSLQESIHGIQDALKEEGFIEHQSIRYAISDVNFQPLLIPQMLTQLRTQHPRVLIAMSTPIAQAAKATVHDTPILFNVVTDPVHAGLLQNALQADPLMTGASDQQNLMLLLQFAKRILPTLHRVGVLYATTESNDTALVDLLKQAAAPLNIEVLAIPIDQARDIPVRIQAFKGKVDFIYVGVSGTIQPTLPIIAAEANHLHIPVLNADSNAVLQHQVLASFGVSYYQVGKNAGHLAAKILKGSLIQDLPPLYPSPEDHHGFINLRLAAQYHLNIPPQLEHTTYVEP